MATDLSREKAAEVMAILVERMEQYGKLLDEFRAGRIDDRDLRRRAVVTGIVQQMDGVWIFDLPNMRWLYYDGVEVRPASDAPAPTRRRARAKGS